MNMVTHEDFKTPADRYERNRRRLLAGIFRKAFKTRNRTTTTTTKASCAVATATNGSKWTSTLRRSRPSAGTRRRSASAVCANAARKKAPDAEKGQTESRQEFEQPNGPASPGSTDPAYLQYTFAQDQRNPRSATSAAATSRTGRK